MERSRPGLNPVGGVPQFAYDPHPIALLAHRAIQKGAHTQLFTNRSRFFFSVFEPERRATTNNFESAYLSQRRNQFFRQSIRKIFVLWITAFVNQRQHCDRFLRARRRHLADSRRPVPNSIPANKEQTDRERCTDEDNINPSAAAGP